MVKKLSSNFKSGKNNKGFILSLDVSMAVFIAFILIAVSVYYVGLASEEPLSKLPLVKAGSDIITMLDYENVLDRLDKIEIQNEMKALLPPGYEMRILINGTFPDQGFVAESTVNPPSKKFIVSGMRSFVIQNETKDYFATANYLVWQK
ncbi:MAG: hypothetical protein Q8O03_02630 [Nanoarchaeota archaeon]|nr:hypothetical protein [Nanoarchaeota archaeon]